MADPYAEFGGSVVKPQGGTDPYTAFGGSMKSMAPPPSFMPGTPNSDAAGRFAQGIANTVNPIPGIQAIANDPKGLQHGIEEGIFAPQAEQFHKANDAIHGRGEYGSMGTAGRLSSAVGHAAAGALPLVGPAAANAGDKIGDGDIAGGLGEATGLALTAATPDIASVTGKGLMRAAEPVAEGALGIRNVDRATAKAPGRAALDMTSGFSPRKVSSSAADVIAAREALRNAILSRSGKKVNLKPAVDEINAAIKKAAAGNSDTDHLTPLKEQLTEPKDGFAGDVSPINTPPPGTIGPSGPLRISDLQDPMQALAMRQRFGNDFTKFDHARPLTKEAQGVGNRAYRKITDEIHAAEPESAAPDRDISNLVPVKNNARVKDLNAGVIQNTMHRVAAHTGAMALGAGAGYEAGGIPGMIAGIVLPEVLSMPEARMAAARGMNRAGKIASNPVAGRAAQAGAVSGNLKHDPLGLGPYLEQQ